MATKKSSTAAKLPTAREKLQPSKLRQNQLELLGDDIDLSDLFLALNHKDINIAEAVTGVTVERTIEGASTLTVEVLDRDRILLRSGRLSSRNDTEIDGLFFRLKAVRKSGSTLELTFEDREVAVLRTYAKPIKQSLKTSRGAITRAEFILRLIKEVKEIKIPYVIPELHVAQPIDGAAQQPPTVQQNNNRGRGIPKANGLNVKSYSMTEEQRKNANTILLTGTNLLVPRPVLVMSIMCAIQESSLINRLPYPLDLGSAIAYSHTNPLMNPTGCFQQIAVIPTGKTDWPASRDVAKDATGFFNICNIQFKNNPHKAYGDIVESVQHSGLSGQQTYGQWRTQAERIVDSFGITADDSTANNSQWAATVGVQTYEFYRGLPNTSKKNKQKYGGSWGPESSWDCIQRLAQEVQWRAFFVSGTFYFISEDDLFKSQPIATINEDTDGVISLDGDYDEGSKVASLTLNCQMNRWAAPPGSIVTVTDMGPWNGRWIVNDVSKSLFDSKGTITLKKPLPRLPEPSGQNIIQGQSAFTGWPKPPKDQQQGTGASAKVPTGDSTSLAQQLLTYHDLGQWTDDNGQGLDQIRRTAAGMMVSSQNASVGQCHIADDVLRAVVWLIGQGYKIGTYAWCSDHHDDGVHGHAGGWAVDISSINGIAITQNTTVCFNNVKAIDELLRNANPPMKPRQLISGGYGNHRDMTLSALSLPAADTFYGGVTMGQHCNHIHVGYGMRDANGQYSWAGA